MGIIGAFIASTGIWMVAFGAHRSGLGAMCVGGILLCLGCMEPPRR